MTMRREDVSVAQQEDTLDQTLYNGIYKVKRFLAHGTWSTIYLASHVTLSIPLAIKQFHTSQALPESVHVELNTLLHASQHDSPIPATPTFSHLARAFPQVNENEDRCFEELVREALFLAGVQHPALPMLYDYFFENDSWYLVMDYIPGIPLDAYLKGRRPLPPLEALDYALQLCGVLEYLHTRMPAIIFCALESSHILLLPDRTIVLIDFGHAHYEKEKISLQRSVSPASNHDSADVTSSMRVDMQEFYDPRLDLYNLGMLLYNMLSKDRPEEYSPLPLASSDNEMLPPLHIVNPEISHVLSGMVKLATCNDPLQRFQSARTFFLALERAFAIEERRLSQTPHSEGEETSQSEETIAWPVPAENFSLHLEHRLQMRTRLLRPQRENTHKKQVSQSLFLTDEGLKNRSLPSLERTIAQMKTEDLRIMPVIDDHVAQRPSRIGTLPQHTVQHIVQTCFVIVLVLFLVLVSLLLYMHSRQPTNPKGPQSVPRVPHSESSMNVVITHSSWQVLPSLPSPEADNAAVYVTVAGRPYIYMNGGYRKSADDVGQYDTDYDHSLYRYDIDAAHWEAVTDTFPGLVNNAATVDEHGTIFFTTGYSSDAYSVISDLWQYQPENGVTRRIQTPAQVMPGFGSAMLADQQGHLFLSQGFLKAGDPHVLANTGWYRYDISTGQWHVLADMPVGLGYVTLALDSSGGILLLGGSTDAGQQTQSDKIYRYDSLHDSWSEEVMTLPHPMSGEASCSPYPGELALVGGVDASQQVGTTNALLLNLHTFHSTSLPTFPDGGSALGAAACDNMGHLFLTRGASDLKLATRDFWLLMVQEPPKLPTPTVVPTETPVSSRVSVVSLVKKDG